MTEFSETDLGQRYASVVQAWQRAWEQVIPFFAFAPEIRKVIKNRGHFPNDEAATKLVWLALRNNMADKMRSVLRWKAAMNQFAIVYGSRFTREQF